MRKKEIIELSITGILVVIMFFALGNAVNKSRSGRTQGILPATAVPKAMPTARARVDQKINSKDLYNLLEKDSQLIELKRDPFTASPIIIKKETQSGIELTGILWDKEKPLAVIDGKIVKEGQRVGDKTVMEIKQDRVILSDGEFFSEVKLRQ